jgi:hypothetical protein
MNDTDAWRAALGMVQHYGPHALQRAFDRIDGMKKSGDEIGATAWALIAEAIMELTRDRRHDESVN